MRQKGAMTLLTTALLLSVTLLLVLGSYKTTFHQIKVAQNELRSRSAHWSGEGALECFYSFLKTGKVHASDLTKGSSHSDYSALQSMCLDIPASEELFAELTAANVYRLVYQVDNVEVLSKSVESSSSGGDGAILATGHFVINGAIEIWPDVTGNQIDGDEECVSVTYAKEVDYIHSGGPTAKLETNAVKPKMSTPVANAKCHSSTVTSLNFSKSTSQDPVKAFFKEDFVKDASLDPFEQFFQKPRSEISSVRSEYKVITGTTTNCDQKIANEFASTDRVWVVGDCDIGSGYGFTTLPDSPRTLVIENGLFGVYSAVLFYGAMYHLNTEPASTDFSSRWALMPSSGTLGASDRKDVAHYQAGSFVSTGGLILDIPYKKSYFFNSMVFKYDPSAKASGSGGTNYFSWRKGSWNDL
ncbi:hypothetical protein [Vibrio sp. LaRot3]|uniref:hypothetical protein n=1 Tax=Vibrio sp. LaRot3 TaxID=2998829 RepID=UPI0022CDE27D|nr:hypothetical protein [Vibrio sp. LaRot3]MDA0149237.1 hypothetical protein [Vibrio sp. LaRot3]